MKVTSQELLFKSKLFQYHAIFNFRVPLISKYNIETGKSVSVPSTPALNIRHATLYRSPSVTDSIKSSVKLSNMYDKSFGGKWLLLIYKFGNGRVVRASVSGAVDLGLILSRLKPKKSCEIGNYGWPVDAQH